MSVVPTGGPTHDVTVIDTGWLSPHFDVTASVATVVLVVTYVVVLPLRARSSYERLKRERPTDPTALVRRLRQVVIRQLAATAVVLLAVAVSSGVDREDVGLTMPHGPNAAQAWGWTLYACVLVLGAGLLMRRRARKGRRITGQALFAALVPATSVERGWGGAAAVGAGLSEELVYRGLFTAAGVALDLSPVTSVLVVSAVFGLAHLYQGVWGVLGTAVVGVVMSWLYLTGRSLLPPMLVHAVIDLRALVLVPLPAAVVAEPKPRRTDRARRRHSAALIAGSVDPDDPEAEPVLP